MVDCQYGGKLSVLLLLLVWVSSAHRMLQNRRLCVLV